MCHTRNLGNRPVGLATTILVTTYVVAIAAVAQAAPTDRPEDCSAYVSVPLPAEAPKVSVPKTTPACASYRSYRGIGRPLNYVDARACAWQERLAAKMDPTGWVIGGSLILADIYFNGAGVKRNVPLAMRFACEFEERAAMLALPDIAKRNGSAPAHGPFEFCDYAATTFTMNFCGGYASEVAADRKTRYYKSLKSSMTSAQEAAFERLLAAQSAYISAHAFEVDQGGTIRGIRTLGSGAILNNLFHTEIVHYERKQWPALSGDQVKTADAVLHRQFEETLEQLRKQTKEDVDEGAVTADHVSDVEAKWEIYRDAWVAFALVRYPSAVDAIRAEITLRRYSLLKTIRSYE